MNVSCDLPKIGNQLISDVKFPKICFSWKFPERYIFAQNLENSSSKTSRSNSMSKINSVSPLSIVLEDFPSIILKRHLSFSQISCNNDHNIFRVLHHFYFCSNSYNNLLYWFRLNDQEKHLALGPAVSIR